MLSDFNPLNIRYSKSNHWFGQTGNHKGFCRFSRLEFGIRAAIVLLKNYYFNYNLRSISSIIKRYAPSTENDTDAYIAFVSHETHLGSDEKLNLVDLLYKVLPAMSKFESGYMLHMDVIDDVVNKYNIFL